jgi:hypothetical protein
MQTTINKDQQLSTNTKKYLEISTNDQITTINNYQQRSTSRIKSDRGPPCASNTKKQKKIPKALQTNNNIIEDQKHKQLCTNFDIYHKLSLNVRKINKCSQMSTYRQNNNN